MSEKYPLEELVRIKKRRLDEAEQHLKEMRRLLEAERKKENECQQRRDKAKKFFDEKLEDVRSEENSAEKIHEKLRFWKEEAKPKLEAQEDLLTKQKKSVKNQEEEVEKAVLNVLKKNQDVEKLEVHRDQWKREVRKVLARKEEAVTDELGSAMHARARLEKRRREEHE